MCKVGAWIQCPRDSSSFLEIIARVDLCCSSGCTDFPSGCTDCPSGRTDCPSGRTDCPSRCTDCPSGPTDCAARPAEERECCTRDTLAFMLLRRQRYQEVKCTFLRTDSISAERAAWQVTRRGNPRAMSGNPCAMRGNPCALRGNPRALRSNPFAGPMDVELTATSLRDLIAGLAPKVQESLSIPGSKV